MKLRLPLLSLILILSISACKKSTVTPSTPPGTDPPVNPPSTSTYMPDNSFKIIAYMPGYKDPATVADAKYKMITHLFFAFLTPNPTADGSFLALTATESARFNTLKAKASENNIKLGVSVMASESIFAAIAGSATSRANLVKNLVDFAKSHGLAGIDIDWEYPRAPTGSSNSDYTSLMKELSTELHKVNKFLSAAVTPAVYQSTNRDAIETAVYQYVDFFNIMQYDGAGYDTAEPLNHASMKMTDASLNIWLTTKGMPKEKAILGMPLYGKDDKGSSIAYRDIETSGADVNSNVAMVNGKTYGFNGIALIKAKTQKAKERCNGIMFWEFTHDSNTSNSLVKAANDQLGRSY